MPYGVVEKPVEKPVVSRKDRTWALISKYQKLVLKNQSDDITYYPTDMTFPERVNFEVMLDVYESIEKVKELYGQE